MATNLLLLGVPYEALNSEAATLTGIPFALPARHSVLDWQVVIDDDEDVTVTLSTAMDLEGPYQIIDTITLTGTELSEIRTIDAAAGRFGRFDITVNVSEVLVIGQIIAKVANS